MKKRDYVICLILLIILVLFNGILGRKIEKTATNTTYSTYYQDTKTYVF